MATLPPISITAIDAASRYAPTRSRHSSASSRAAIPVESTRSQNITVMCLRSPVASRAGMAVVTAIGCADAGSRSGGRVEVGYRAPAFLRRSTEERHPVSPSPDRSGRGRTERSMRFSAKRWAYSDMPSLSSHSAISCTAAHLRRTLRYSGRRLSEAKASSHFGRGVLRLVMAALAPQGVFVSRYFPGRQTAAGIVLKLASRECCRPARGPRMRQGRRPVRERSRRRVAAAAQVPVPMAVMRKPSAPQARQRARSGRPCVRAPRPRQRPPNVTLSHSSWR